MEPINELSADLGWRETELGILKILLQRSDFSVKQHEVIARAAWALLYAHYEGFVKFSLTVFFDRVSKAMESCEHLPLKTKEHALAVEINRLRSLPAGDFLLAVETFKQGTASKKPSFPEVDTKSNLWPNVFEDLLELADLKCLSVDKHRVLLRTLVRNGIA